MITTAMDFQIQTFIFQVMLYTCINFNVLRYTKCMTLTTQNIDYFENSDATLRCSDEGKLLEVIRWIQRDPPLTAYMVFRNGRCDSAGFISYDIQNYLFDCTDGTVYLLTLKNISRTMNGKTWTCGGYIYTKSESNTVTIYVKVPVTTTTISTYSNVITQTENTTITFQCFTSECNPEPDFMWYKDHNIMTDGDELLLSENFATEVSPLHIVKMYNNSFTIRLTREMNGWYLFCAAGVRNSSKIPSEKIGFNVTYPPRVNAFENKTIIEGDNLDYSCSFTRGNPIVTNVTWSWKDTTWNDQQLILNNVSRNQAGVYRCTVTNSLLSSGNTETQGKDIGEFNLIVEYRTKVLNFVATNNNKSDIIEVEEKDAVILACDIEGYPLPTGEIVYQEASFMQNPTAKFQSRPSTLNTSTNLRITSHIMAQCTDYGIQTCRGSNTLQNGFHSESNKNISLFVNCKPRKSPFFLIPDTVLSPLSVEVVLSFTALAYPVPHKSGYVWTRHIKETDMWKNITDNAQNINIRTTELQSNLTIKDVSERDYGLYRLSITNDVGEFNHTFNLIPAVYDSVGTPAPSSISSLAVAGAGFSAGSVVFMVTVIIIVVFCKRRQRNKEQDVPIQYRAFSSPKDDGTSVVGGSSDEYQGLSNAGLEQQYEQMSCDCQDGKGREKVYENMQLTRVNWDSSTKDSSLNVQTA